VMNVKGAYLLLYSIAHTTILLNIWIGNNKFHFPSTIKCETIRKITLNKDPLYKFLNKVLNTCTIVVFYICMHISEYFLLF